MSSVNKGKGVVNYLTRRQMLKEGWINLVQGWLTGFRQAGLEKGAGKPGSPIRQPPSPPARCFGAPRLESLKTPTLPAEGKED